METASFVMSIISLLVSGILAFIPIHYNYCQKKEELVLTICDGVIRDNIVAISISYNNIGWRDAILCSSCLHLEYDGQYIGNSVFDKINHKYACEWKDAILLKNRTLALVKLEYKLPQNLSDFDMNKVNVFVNTQYISAQGDRMSAQNFVGKLFENECAKSVVIESYKQELKGSKIIMSMNL